MNSFKDSSFQDRLGRAAEAKNKALEQLRTKPPMDENVIAERKAAAEKRDAAKAEKAAAKRAAIEAEAEAKAAVPPPPTEAEKKAARDARYAARKNRR